MKVKKSLWVVLACVLALSFAAVACDAKSADNYTVESVTLSEDEITIKVGEKTTLTYTVEPADCADEVKWRSSDTDHVTVSSGGENPGEVTGVAVTDEPVTITLQVGDMKDTCKVTVVEGETVAVTGVTLNKSELTLTEGGSEKLTATVTPADATDKTVTWESDKMGVATVGKDGTVTAVAAGTATITAKAGGKSATCTVTVNAKEVPATGVTINKDTLTLTEGGASDTLTATVTPANSTDTVAWSVTAGDDYIDITPNGNTVTVKPVAAGTATITATAGDFSDTCTVTVNALQNATISIGGKEYTYSYTTNGTAIENVDADGKDWWAGATVGQSASGDFAVIYTWEKSNTESTYNTDVGIDVAQGAAFNDEGYITGATQFYTFQIGMGGDTGWGTPVLNPVAAYSSSVTKNGVAWAEDNFPGTSENSTSMNGNTSFSFLGQYTAVIARASTQLVVEVTFVQADTNDTYVYTYTAKYSTDADLATRITGNPYFIKNITVATATLSEVTA